MILTFADIADLAPAKLVSLRTERYQGQDERGFLADFAAPDRQLLRSVYDDLLELLARLKPVYTEPGLCLETVLGYLGENRWEKLVDEARLLGQATPSPSPALRRKIHDLRGGALSSLLIRLQLMEIESPKPEEAQQVFFLVRDHLKIMRNCVSDLDPERYAADSSQCDHAISLLAEKWSKASFCGGENRSSIELLCGYEGVICESCLEFSALDRIIYNLMNNAARFTADGRVLLAMAPVPDADAAEHVRFVVANRIAPEHAAVLRAKFGERLDELLRGGFTTGGSGLGLRICADFCSQAYGLVDFDRARDGGYFGIRLREDGLFLVWFHWPTRGD